MSGGAETQIASESKFGIYLEHVGKLRKLPARGLIERVRDDVGAHGIAIGIALVAVPIVGPIRTQIAVPPNLAGSVEGSLRADENRVEEAVAFHTAADHFLQSHSKRKHGNKGGDTRAMPTVVSEL